MGRAAEKFPGWAGWAKSIQDNFQSAKFQMLKFALITYAIELVEIDAVGLVWYNIGSFHFSQVCWKMRNVKEMLDYQQETSTLAKT